MKNRDSTESMNWAQVGVKILHGGTLFTFHENEHGRVGFVRVCHFVEDPLNVAKNWTRNQRRGRGEGDRGRERGRKDSVKERAYTGKGIFKVAGSGRSWENQTILGNTLPSRNGNDAGII